MNNTARIEEIKKRSPRDLFYVKKGSQYWQIGDSGYTDDISLAKVFKRSEILNRLKLGGFINKEIILK